MLRFLSQTSISKKLTLQLFTLAKLLLLKLATKIIFWLGGHYNINCVKSLQHEESLEPLLKDNAIQYSAYFVPRTNWHANRLSDKTFVQTSSFFFLCIPSRTTKPQSQLVIYHLKSFTKCLHCLKALATSSLSLPPSS